MNNQERISVKKGSSPKFTELNDLASQKVGGGILFATDDWFAAAENLLLDSEPVFIDGKFTTYGKWMDGWESRRKRIAGHDWCIIKLGAPGLIHGVDIDTAHFTGNYAPRVSIQAASLLTNAPEPREGDRMGLCATPEETMEIAKLKSETWEEILPMREMQPGTPNTRHNYFKINSTERWTHLRINMYPDGGIARLRVYGQVVPDWEETPDDETLDLAAMLNGGVCVGYSNIHFGHARNVIQPNRGKVMSDGWETARRLDRPPILETDENGVLQVPGSEWAEFKLGHTGIIEEIEIDTNHFKGNFPDSCYIEGALSTTTDLSPAEEGEWKMLLPVQKLSAHKRHYYGKDFLKDIGPISHFRAVMAPDGGISRIRLNGRVAFIVDSFQ